MNKSVRNISGRLKTILIFSITFLITFIILLTAIATKKYDLKAGEIAKNPIKANREIVDEIATETARKEATQKINKQFVIKNEVQNNAEDNIKAFFSNILEINESTKTDDEKIEQLMNTNSIKLDREGYQSLLALNRGELISLQSILIEALGKAYVNPIEEGKQSDIESAKLIADSKIDPLDYSRSLKDTLKSILYSQIQPNYFEDKEKTEEKAKEAEKSIPTVVIKKGQIVVKEGEPVTEHQIEILKSMGLLNESKFDYLIYIALALLILVILLLEFFMTKRSESEEEYNKKIILISSINILSLIIARLLAFISPMLVPFAFAPIIMSMLIGKKAAISMSILNAVLISVAVNFNAQSIIIMIISIIIGSTIISKMQQRNDIMTSSFYVCIINSIITLTSGFILSNNNMEILLNVVYTAVGGVFSGILAIGFLPLFESIFDIVTNVKLLELSNPNSPLLKKLIMEAPGTYNHSMLVANLSEVAAEEIGANATLARVGAYYHDVGKTIRPRFFKENQMNMENPHDKIAPDLSALIIISHVKEGLELAEKYKIPKVIKDIIVQHHGTTTVKYFYITARNQSENPDDVKIEDYTYPGKIPVTKEAAIIMLADSVEAAVRSIKDPTEEKINKMIENIFNGKIEEHQLDNSELTFKDLRIIKKCFLKTINGIYHQRIEYPTEKVKENLKNDIQ